MLIEWRSVARNVFSNWASYVVSAATGFLLAPFVLHRLGDTGYGVWTIVLSLTGYCGLLDLGIRSSVGRFVGRHVTLNEETGVNQIVSTAFAILAAGGVLAIVITLVIVNFFFNKFHIAPQFLSTGRVALLIAGLNVAVALPLGVFSSVLIALGRFDLLSATSIAGELTRAALTVTCLKLGYGLTGLAAVGLFTTLGGYTATVLFAKKLYPSLMLGLRFATRARASELFGFGIFRFVWIVANQLIFYSDSVVIALFLGPAAVTPYAIAGSLINYGRNIVNLVSDTFGPPAFRLDAKQDRDGLKALLILGTKIVLLVAIPLNLGFYFLGRQFITLWMGKEHASSAAILSVLVIAQFTGMAQYASATVLTAMAKHRILGYLSLAEGLLNLLLSVILVRKIGVMGVAWGTVIPALISTGLVVPWYAMRVVKMRMREYLTALFGPLICAVPVAALAYLYGSVVKTPSWQIFGGEAISITCVLALASFFFCLDSAQRKTALDRLSRRLYRKPVAYSA